MLILKDLLLWTLVSVHLVGAAFLFRRLFPRESVWLAFIVPALFTVLVSNFIEYHVALTNLRIVLPLTTAASVAGIFWRKSPWRVMRLPTLIFLGAFAFTFGLRMLRPSIEDVRDGIPDLSLIANYLFGQTLPAEATWLPPIKMKLYYCFEHYGASLLIRLLGVNIGTGFNLCAALLSAYTCFLAAAIAWHLSRGKLWVVLLMLVMTACGGTGATGYLWLTSSNLDPQNMIDPYSMIDGKTVPSDWFLRHLTPIIDIYQQHLLMPPSYGAWIGCFHSAQAGQLMICFSLLALIEVARRRATIWPWLLLGLSPFLMLVTCIWGVPMVVFMIAGGFLICRGLKLAPANLPVLLAASAGLAVLLEPMLLYFLEPYAFSDITWATGYHTQVLEFMVQWWPVYLPWLCLLCVWNRVHPATRMVLVMAPLAFAGMETWNFGQRFDATSKFWGLIYIAAWVAFVPEIARQKSWPFRVVLALMIVNGLLSIGFWATYYHRAINWGEIAHLDGLGQLQQDRRKARILETVSRLDNQTIIPGKSSWAGAESALVPLLSHNRAYVTWSNFSDTILYSNGITEALRREVDVNELYDGKIPDALIFLRQRNIAALVIYPDDNIEPAVVDQMKQDLAPYYTYEEANLRTLEQMEAGLSPVRPCAGVFVFHPEVNSLLGSPKGTTMNK